MNENVLFSGKTTRDYIQKKPTAFLFFPMLLASTYSTNSWSRKLLVVGSRLKQTIKQ